jgi:hypothetical protein
LKREAEKSRLLKRLAELMVEEQRAAGVFERTPHFSQLEDACHGLGQEVAQASLVRAAREAAAAGKATAGCPQCRQSCLVTMKKRLLHGLDGPVEVAELMGHCPACRRDFFPSA